MVKLNKKLILCLLISAVLQSLHNFKFGNANPWDINYIATRLEIAVWIGFSFSIIPYKYLFTKSCLFGLCLIELPEFLIYLFNLNVYLICGIRGFIFIIGMAYIFSKSYCSDVNELDEKHFFIVGIKPKKLTGFHFILSLFHKDPYGGVGVYAAGKLYHYRRDYITIEDRKYIESRPFKYRIIKRGKLEPERLKQLESLKGSKREKWSLKYNCMTVLEPILSKRGKPLI